MKKESGICVRPNYRRGKGRYPRMETAGDTHNVAGILMALRYLSHEAQGAGLTELAITLEDAAVQCGRHIARAVNGYKGT
jgi:hypothetical protein